MQHQCGQHHRVLHANEHRVAGARRAEWYLPLFVFLMVPLSPTRFSAARSFFSVVAAIPFAKEEGPDKQLRICLGAKIKFNSLY